MALNLQTGEIALGTVLRHALDGMFMVDRSRRVVFFSEACERMTGTSREAIVGTLCPCHEVFDCRDEHGRSLSGVLCPSIQILNRDLPSARQRLSVRRPDGRRVWVETTYSPVYADDGDVACVLAVMRDVTETKEREDELRETVERMMTLDPQESSVPDDGSIAAQYDNGDPPAHGADGMGPLDRILTGIEKREILAALKRAQGQRTQAARLLGISRSRLYRRMEALGIDPRGLGYR